MNSSARRTADAPRSARDHIGFARAWLAAPLRTGAVAPSSDVLARHMAFAAALRPGCAVLELGPGTGVVTRALLACGVSEDALTLVEANPGFAELLAERFPKAVVITGDAFETVRQLAGTGQEIAAVVSSLPLYVYPRQLRQDLCRQALRLVGPGGRLVQFTYGPVSPIAASPDMLAIRSRRIWGNVPPAVVWTYQAANPTGC